MWLARCARRGGQGRVALRAILELIFFFNLYPKKNGKVPKDFAQKGSSIDLCLEQTLLWRESERQAGE